MFFKLIENFLTEKECDELINMGESHSLIEMKSSKFINGKLVDSNLEYSGNKRMGCYFVGEFLLDPQLEKLSKKIIDTSNELQPFKSIEYREVPKYSFNRYLENDFLDWHEDKHEIINGATLTYIIQLNDGYDGGDVKYIIEGIEYNVPKLKGSVFVFDSNITHSVESVKSGKRYSLNVWPSSIKKVSLI